MSQLIFSKIQDLYSQLREETIDADFLVIFTPSIYVGITTNGDYSSEHPSADRDFLNCMNANQRCKTLVFVGLQKCFIKKNSKCSQCSIDYVSRVMRLFNTSEVLNNITFKLLENNNYRLFAVFKKEADPIIYMSSASMANTDSDELIVRIVANDELVNTIKNVMLSGIDATFENLVQFIELQSHDSGIDPQTAFSYLYSS